MTKSQELRIYKRALFWYKLSVWLPVFKIFFGTFSGFCWYFTGKRTFFVDLPVLYRQYIESERYGRMYWFTPGECIPRIKELRKAIATLENELSELMMYERALFWYKLSVYLPFMKLFFCTDVGFCWYFLQMEWRNFNFVNFPALYRQYIQQDGGLNTWWYKKGDCKSRIKELKIAIQTLEFKS